MTAGDGFVEATRQASLIPLHPKDAWLHDRRLSDVDEWGRSEHMRTVARQVYGPLYRSWFRVEWQGLERIPTSGGALLIANHAGAIPSDAPVIMHGIEEELGRPVYGLADHIFKTCSCREPHPTSSRHEPVLVNEVAELVGPSQSRRIGMPNQ